MFIDDLRENARTINRAVRNENCLNAYIMLGIRETGFAPVRRIIGARVRKNVLQVKSLNCVAWISVNPDQDIIYFQ